MTLPIGYENPADLRAGRGDRRDGGILSIMCNWMRVAGAASALVTCAVATAMSACRSSAAVDDGGAVDAAASPAQPTDAGDAGPGPFDSADSPPPTGVPAIDCGVPGAAAPPGALAVGQAGARAIALEGDDVYWIDLGAGGGEVRNSVIFTMNGSVRRCSKAGCNLAPVVLTSGFQSLPDSVPPFAVGAKGVFFGDVEGIEGLALDAAGASAVPLGFTGATSIAVDDTNLYVATSGGLYVQPLGADAGPTAFLDGGPNEPMSVAVDATDVYALTYWGDVLRCPIGGCSGGTPVPVVAGSNLPFVGHQIALDAANVYWTVFNGGPGSIYTCPKTGCAAPVPLVSNRVGLGAIASDGVALYFVETGSDTPTGGSTSGSGGVYKCAVGGCNDQPTVVAGFQPYPVALAVDPADGGQVYWSSSTCQGSTVLSGPK
jgi:hypothetical protein